MSRLFSNLVFKAYQTFGLAVYPFMGPLLRFRANRNKEDRKRRYERYGYPSADKPAGPLIWFHAASVGECMAIIPLVEHVSRLDINVIMTTGTVTSAQIVHKQLSWGIHHQYMPLDLKPALERFLNHWKPDTAVFTESEIWPMTLIELAKRDIPRLLVNARMSDKSFRRWKKSAGLAENLFSYFSHVIAKSELDADRFRILGAHPVEVSGNLKADITSLPIDENEWLKISASIGSRPCWVAVSTHEGEEEIAGRIHAEIKNRIPELLTVIVPRHPDRGPDIATLLQQSNFKVSCRSVNHAIAVDTDIYLGDTIGEMGLYLRLAQVAFMGKSLKTGGGQNPLEPAMAGIPVISGQEIHNFRETYKYLLEGQAVRLVADEAMLCANIEYLLHTPVERERMVKAAYDSVWKMQGPLKRTINVLDAYFFPLIVKYGMEEID